MSLNALLDQNVTVLTASRRLAHALRIGYARHAQQQGFTVWRTPRILPWTAWLREQWREMRAGDPVVATRLLTPAQARVLWRRIVAASAAGEKLLSTTSAAHLAEKSWRRLHEYLIPLDELAHSDQLETRALHEWCTSFAQRCIELDVIEDAQLPAWAERCELTPVQPIALAGFDHVPPALAQLTTAWASAGRFIGATDISSEAPHVQVVGAPDAAHELQLAARWARALLEAQGADIGVLVPGLQRRQHDVRRVFEDVFSPGARSAGADVAAAPIVIAAAGPLSEHPLVDAALCVLRLADRADGALTGRVLRSPFIAGGVSERDARALADFRLREEQRESWSWFELEHWGGAASAAELQLAARAVSALLRAELSATAPSRWAERFQAVLQAAGWPGERTLNSPEQQTLLKFAEALAEFGALDVVLPKLTLRQALSQLTELLRETPFEPQSPNASITIIDPATAAGMSFDALWVTGLDADRLPGPVTPDPLIPLEFQRAAGIPQASAESVRQLALTQFERWLRSAQTLVLSWPKREGDADIEPSPLLSRWPGADASSVEASGVRSLRHSLFDGRPAPELLLDEQAPSLASGAARGGARILELQSHCPFRAQAELRLHARPTPEITVGLDPRQRGKILHKVLEHVWGKLQDNITLADTDDATLAGDVRSIAERETAHVMRVATGHRARLAKLEVESVTRQVMRLLDIERERPPFRVRFAEAAEAWRIGGLSITLRPDRIDELANHGALLIDYKLGDSHKPRGWLDERPGRPRSPQLPLYALAHEVALEGLAYVTMAPGAVEYRGWSRTGAVGAGVPTYPVKISKKLNPPPDWQTLLQYWRRSLTSLADGYVRGDAAVDPLPQVCTHCHLSMLCRIHERSRTLAGGEDEPND